MMIPMPDYTHLGHEYLDKVKNSLGIPQVHSGVDLNYGRPWDDLGKEVVAMGKGSVVFSRDTGKGWGNMIVIYHPTYRVWSRYAHLETLAVRVGEEVEEGQKIGTCGHSGGSWKPHLHWDVIRKVLDKWTNYTSFWSAEKTQEYYLDPLKFVAETKDEEPIVKWHKENKIIEKWSVPPTPIELKLAWTVYKALKANKDNNLKFNL